LASVTETDVCIMLLFKYHVGHGTIFPGLYFNRKNGADSLQKNFIDRELRYVCNIPGGRRHRVSAAASSLLTKGLPRILAVQVSAEGDAEHIELRNYSQLAKERCSGDEVHARLRALLRSASSGLPRESAPAFDQLIVPTGQLC
jgi:hypothetical protein